MCGLYHCTVNSAPHYYYFLKKSSTNVFRKHFCYWRAVKSECFQCDKPLLFTPKIRLIYDLGLLRTHSLLSVYDCYCSKNMLIMVSTYMESFKKISLFEVLTMHFHHKIKNMKFFDETQLCWWEAVFHTCHDEPFTFCLLMWLSWWNFDTCTDMGVNRRRM